MLMFRMGDIAKQLWYAWWNTVLLLIFCSGHKALLIKSCWRSKLSLLSLHKAFAVIYPTNQSCQVYFCPIFVYSIVAVLLVKVWTSQPTTEPVKLSEVIKAIHSNQMSIYQSDSRGGGENMKEKVITVLSITIWKGLHICQEQTFIYLFILAYCYFVHQNVLNNIQAHVTAGKIYYLSICTYKYMT